MQVCVDCSTTVDVATSISDKQLRCTPCHVAFMDKLEPEPHDPVSHPAHYTSDPSGVECIQITRHRNFNIGNAIKYLWRAGLKNPTSVRAQTEDLKKAIWYINDEIARLAAK